MDDGAAPLVCNVEHAHCPQAVGHLLGEPALDPRRLRQLGGVEELGQRQREHVGCTNSVVDWIPPICSEIVFMHPTGKTPCATQKLAICSQDANFGTPQVDAEGRRLLRYGFVETERVDS